MCEALRNLMREEIAEEKKKARQEGLQEGREEGRQAGLQEGRQVGLQEGRQVGLQEGRQAGLQEGRQEARQEAQENLVEIIKNLMTNMKLTADQALSAMNIPAEKWGFYKAKL